MAKKNGAKPARGEPATQARTSIKDVAAQVAALADMAGAALADRYAELHGHAPRSRNLQWLRKACAMKIQVDAEGSLSQAALDRIAELQPGTMVRHRLPARRTATTGDLPPASNRDPRLPAVGETIVKVFRGEEHRVLVREDGFVWNGSTYASLSKLAKAITDSTWNGFLFFGLTATKGGAA